MIVTCPNCQVRYNLPDEKVSPKGVRVKCSQCAHIFKAELPTPEEEVESLLETEDESPTPNADEDFDAAFDEVAAGKDQPEESSAPSEDATTNTTQQPEEEQAESNVTREEQPSPSPSTDTEALFDDDESQPESSEPSTPSTTAEDVAALFGDDEELEETASQDSEDSLFDEKDDAVDELDEPSDSDDDDDDDDDTEVDFGLDIKEEPKSKGKTIGYLIIALICVGAFAIALYFKVWTLLGIDASLLQNIPYIGQMMSEDNTESETPPGESPADKIRKIQLKDVKQYYVANEKTGNIFVVEGKAVNNFSHDKEQIKVEVLLYDDLGNVLVSKAFLCGNVLSQFQLQVQTQKEIEDGLQSDVGILSNNTLIHPKGETPFMMVFFTPPSNVREFLVKVIDAKDSL